MQPAYFNLTDADHHHIRAMYQDNKVWFIASDIARALGDSDTFGKPLSTLFSDVPESWKKVDSYQDESTEARLFIAEPGIYFFLGSYKKKPTAKKLMTCLEEQILPEIKKQVAGIDSDSIGVDQVEEILGDPDAFIKTLQAYKQEKELREKAEARSLQLEAEKIKLEERKAHLEAKISNDAEKVKLAEAIEVSPTSVSIGSFAKILRNSGISIAEKKLFSLLYRYKYLIRKGKRRRTAYQKWIDMGLFEVTEKLIQLKDGTEQPIITTMITGRGQKHLLKVIPKLIEKEEQQKSSRK